MLTGCGLTYTTRRIMRRLLLLALTVASLFLMSGGHLPPVIARPAFPIGATPTPTDIPTPGGTLTPPPTDTPAPPPTPTACYIYYWDVGPDNPFYPYVRCLACRGI